MKMRRCGLVVGFMFALGMAGGLSMAQTGAPASAVPATAANATEARQHLEKAGDLYRQGKYDEALEEVNAALAADPNRHDAQMLKQVIETRMAGTGGTGGTVATGPAGPHTLLTKDEINRLKINELNLNEPKINEPSDLRTVQGSIPRKDLEAFWNEVILKDASLSDAQKSKASHDAFLQPGNLGMQIRLMQDQQQPAYYSKVTIANDPAVMAKFKTLVQPFVLQNCATSQCHGGKDPHGFPWIVPNGNDLNAVAYTNFYILNKLTYGENQILDRNNPEKSLLIQYAANPKAGMLPHPDVNKKPLPVHSIVDLNDPKALRLIAWIKSLRFPAPDYGINYPVQGAPSGAPASAPAPAADQVPAAPGQ